MKYKIGHFNKEIEAKRKKKKNQMEILEMKTWMVETPSMVSTVGCWGKKQWI